MKLGLYQLKYPARKLIEGVLPYVKDLSPNTISLLLLPVGLGIAFCTYLGLHEYPNLLLIGFVLCFIRMFLGTLDGLMAVRFDKSTSKGELLNRLTPELCDVMYLAAIVLARPDLQLPGFFMLALAWLISFSGMLGAVVHQPTQSVGPVGQTDRLATFMLVLLLAYYQVSFDVIALFVWWGIVGGIFTVSLRLWRTFHVAR